MSVRKEIRSEFVSKTGFKNIFEFYNLFREVAGKNGVGKGEILITYYTSNDAAKQGKNKKDVSKIPIRKLSIDDDKFVNSPTEGEDALEERLVSIPYKVLTDSISGDNKLMVTLTVHSVDELSYLNIDETETDGNPLLRLVLKAPDLDAYRLLKAYFNPKRKK